MLVALAALLLLIGGLTAYASRELFDSDRFAGRALTALEEDDVRGLVGARVAEGVVRAEPNLIGATPIVEGAAEGIVGSPPFEQLFRGAVEDLHRTVFGSDKDTIALKLADVGVLLIESLEQVAPELAESIPDAVEPRLLAISSGEGQRALTTAARVAEDIEWAAIVALVLGAVLLGAAVAASADRRRTVRRAGVAVAVAGVAAVVALEIGRALVAGVFAEPGDAAAARAVWDAFLGDLLVWNLALAAVGVVVAAAAASLIRPVEMAPWTSRAWATVATTPESPRLRVVRAVALVAAGIVLVAARDAAIRLAVAALGIGLAYVGIAELLRMTLPATPQSLAPRGRAWPGWRRPATAVLVSVAAIAAVVGVIAVTAGADDADLDVRACNGAAALCDRTIDQVAFPSTHNSMSAADQERWLFAQQERGIPSQLEAGIRGLLIDTHYGVETDQGIYTVLQAGSNSREKLVDAVGEQFVRTAERLRTRIGYSGGGDREVYLCHAYCEVGAIRAEAALESIRDYLVVNPYEVVLISVEDDTAPEDTAEVFQESGLLDMVWRRELAPGSFPTLREMIEADRRVIVMVEDDVGDVPWMQQQFDVVQETPFKFDSTDQLASRRSCRLNRGAAENPLFLLNNWVDTSPAPLPTNARVVNARDALLRRARACGRIRGLLPNLLAVDFYEQGDVTGVARTLNRRPPATDAR